MSSFEFFDRDFCSSTSKINGWLIGLCVFFGILLIILVGITIFFCSIKPGNIQMNLIERQINIDADIESETDKHNKKTQKKSK